MSDIPGGGVGFLSGLAGIAGTIASAVGHFFQLTLERVLEFVRYLKDLVVTLSRELVVAAFRLGRALAHIARDLGVLAAHGLRNLGTWVYNRLLRLSTWLKDRFGPVLEYLHKLKEKIKEIYDRFVKPIVDTIEFIRALNRILQVFHIDLLSKLDATLARVEDTLRKPFLWVEQKITWLENWIDRIVELDGTIQRLALLRSMVRNAPPWVAGFWNTQADRDAKAGDEYSRGRIYPRDEVWAPGKELALFYRGQRSRMDAQIAELVPVWRQAAGIDPPGEEV